MNKDDILNKIANASLGVQRQEIVDNDDVSAITKIGSNVTMFCKDKDGNISLLLIARRNQNGTSDGLGALGGLGEYISQEDFNNTEKKYQLLGKIDNVIERDGVAQLTDNLSIISLNNVKREVREELNDLGIDQEISFKNMKKVALPIVDDDFIVNRWNGQGEAFVVKPQSYIMEVEESFIDELVAKSDKADISDNSELFGLCKVPLKEALQAYGSKEGYRYPHEWLSSWFVAAEGRNLQETNTIFEHLEKHPSYEKALDKMKLSSQVLKNQLCLADVKTRAGYEK